MLVYSALIVFAIFALALFGIAVKDVVVYKKQKRKFNFGESLSAYLMLLPAVILAFFFILLPIIFSLSYAFTDYELLKPDQTKFIGLKNFELMFNELKSKGDLFISIKNTLKFVIGVVPLQIGLALGLALFVNRKKTAVGIFKVCFFAPVVISLTVTSYLWLKILSPAPEGLMNSLLKIFGVETQSFMEDRQNAMWWIVLLSAWQGCGYQMLIFLSGLSNVRKELYEAASLDGANSFKQFIHVTVPGLRSTFLFIVITVFVGACRIMIQPMLMTGYVSHTMTLSFYMYQYGMKYGEVGYSSAIALLMTIVIGAITYLQRRFLSEKD